jgi:hypothetical protein
MLTAVIQGPFTSPDRAHQLKHLLVANTAAFACARAGVSPIVPHWNTAWLDGTISAHFWYEATLELSRRADFQIFVPGWERSRGSLDEHAWGLEKGKTQVMLHAVPLLAFEKELPPDVWVTQIREAARGL